MNFTIRKTELEVRAEFPNLANDLRAYEVDVCLVFIQTREKIETINRKMSSYGWKHEAEQWCRENKQLFCNHISEDAFIIAAMMYDLKYAKCYEKSFFFALE